MPFKKTLSESASRSSFTSMILAGIVSGSIGLVTLLGGLLFYDDLPIFDSISESASFGLPVLSFALGMVCMFLYTYNGYDGADNFITRMIAAGFTIVAMQPCISTYNENSSKVGLLGLSPDLSNTVHCIGAITAFFFLWYWITFQFTKGVFDVTAKKKKRNVVYRICGALTFVGLVAIILCKFIDFNDGLPSFWIAEEVCLVPVGVAMVVKGGGLLGD